MKLLSIITPYYNTYEYTKRLSEVLIPQLTDEVEWIIIDDGCNDNRIDDFSTKAIHLPENSGNACRPRNVGLDHAEGKYIAFVDSDDLVVPNYIKTILEKIKTEEFDYCYLSWKGAWKERSQDFIIEDEPEEWNAAIWKCIYSKEIIGIERFDENYNMGEDTDFNKRVIKGKKANIKDILYIHQYDEREDSLTNLFYKGLKTFTRDE